MVAYSSLLNRSSTSNSPKLESGRAFSGLAQAAPLTPQGEGKCVTGDCGDKLYYNGLGGAMSATIARLAYDDHNHNLYNVSFVDDYNVPITITPYTGPHDFKCHYVGCKKYLSALCPAGLQVH